jgi:transcriptional regulator with XRE-family HTH domain
MKSNMVRVADCDRYVGNRIRQRRIMNGLSQQQLADLIGTTYQQEHKYERGINRVSAGRLYSIAQALEASIGYFFEGLESEQPRKMTGRQRMCLDVARNFTAIRDEKLQKALAEVARALVPNMTSIPAEEGVDLPPVVQQNDIDDRDGIIADMKEIACQHGEGERMAEETLFYDPAQRTPKKP